jgi:tetratricopeptide (TPR) repeat protein
MQPAESLALAKRLLDEGKLDESAAAFRDALRDAALEAEAQYGIGYIKLKSGNLDTAAGAFRACLKANPRHANAAYQLGLIAEQEHQPDIAQAYYRRAIGSNPDHKGALRKLQENSSSSPPKQLGETQVSSPGSGHAKVTESGFYRLLLDDHSPLTRQVVQLVQSLEMSVHPRFSAYLGQLAILLLLPTAILIIIAGQQGVPGATLFSSAVVLSVPFIWLVLHIKTREITFAEARIIIASGVLFRSKENIELYRVSNIRLTQTLLNRITRNGSLIMTVDHGGQQTTKIILRGLARYDRLDQIASKLRNLVLLLRSGNWGKGVIY